MRPHLDSPADQFNSEGRRWGAIGKASRTRGPAHAFAKKLRACLAPQKFAPAMRGFPPANRDRCGEYQRLAESLYCPWGIHRVVAASRFRAPKVVIATETQNGFDMAVVAGSHAPDRLRRGGRGADKQCRRQQTGKQFVGSSTHVGHFVLERSGISKASDLSPVTNHLRNTITPRNFANSTG